MMVVEDDERLCPKCQWRTAVLCRPASWENALVRAYLHPFRCRSCFHRFYRFDGAAMLVGLRGKYTNLRADFQQMAQVIRRIFRDRRRPTRGELTTLLYLVYCAALGCILLHDCYGIAFLSVEATPK